MYHQLKRTKKTNQFNHSHHKSNKTKQTNKQNNTTIKILGLLEAMEGEELIDSCVSWYGAYVDYCEETHPDQMLSDRIVPSVPRFFPIFSQHRICSQFDFVRTWTCGSCTAQSTDLRFLFILGSIQVQISSCIDGRRSQNRFSARWSLLETA
jgi:hypothetical protein